MSKSKPLDWWLKPTGGDWVDPKKKLHPKEYINGIRALLPHLWLIQRDVALGAGHLLQVQLLLNELLLAEGGGGYHASKGVALLDQASMAASAFRRSGLCLEEMKDQADKEGKELSELVHSLFEQLASQDIPQIQRLIDNPLRLLLRDVRLRAQNRVLRKAILQGDFKVVLSSLKTLGQISAEALDSLLDSQQQLLALIAARRVRSSKTR